MSLLTEANTVFISLRGAKTTAVKSQNVLNPALFGTVAEHRLKLLGSQIHFQHVTAAQQLLARRRRRRRAGRSRAQAASLAHAGFQPGRGQTFKPTQQRRGHAREQHIIQRWHRQDPPVEK